MPEWSIYLDNDVVEELSELEIVGLGDAAHVDPPGVARLLHVGRRHTLHTHRTKRLSQPTRARHKFEGT